MAGWSTLLAPIEKILPPILKSGPCLEAGEEMTEEAEPDGSTPPETER